MSQGCSRCFAISASYGASNCKWACFWGSWCGKGKVTWGHIEATASVQFSFLYLSLSLYFSLDKELEEDHEGSCFRRQRTTIFGFPQPWPSSFDGPEGGWSCRNCHSCKPDQRPVGVPVHPTGLRLKIGGQARGLEIGQAPWSHRRTPGGSENRTSQGMHRWWDWVVGLFALVLVGW